MGQCDRDRPGERTQIDDVRQIRGRRTEDVYQWSDPRLPTTLLATGNFDEYGTDATAGPGTQSALMWGSLVSPDGLWEGTFSGAQYVDEVLGVWTATHYALAGQGDRAQTLAIIYMDYEAGGTTTYEDVIFEGQAPPLPELAQ